MPHIFNNNVTIDGSNAGVILDGSNIGAAPVTVWIDDVSLSVDDGPNILSNGDFSAGQGHWRPDDVDPDETNRLISTSQFTSPPNSYEWSATAHTGESRTFYDITDTSAPITDWPYHDDSTIWIPVTGGSNIDVDFWYKDNGGALWVEMQYIHSDGYEDWLGEWGLMGSPDWTQASFSQTLPEGATGVSLELRFAHSEAYASGLTVWSDSNTIMGLQIVNFPSSGINIQGGFEDNTIGGDQSIGDGPLGQGNLLSGNDRGILAADVLYSTITGNYIGTDVTGATEWGNSSYGIQLGGNNNRISNNLISANSDGILLLGNHTTNNIISGNFIGTDATGLNALGNDGGGISLDDDASYNIIGGNNSSPGGACSGDCNLVSGNGSDGIGIQAMNNTVSGNYIGTDVNGTSAIPNHHDGIYIEYYDASNNLIGGNTPGKRNLVSGNRDHGVRIRNGASNNTVSGNYIGTDASGTVDLGNGYDGIKIDEGCRENLIGGDESGEGNLISGNDWAGIIIRDFGSDYNTISGNFIGTDATGKAIIGQGGTHEGRNYDGVGIWHGASHNIVGGDTPGERNIISGNGTHGVRIEADGSSNNTVSGNYIGTDVSGTIALGNLREGVHIGGGGYRNIIGGDDSTEGNLISGNGSLGVQMYGELHEEAAFTTVQGNIIGTDISGTLDLGNGLAGVSMGGNSRYNTVGPDNIIAYSGVNGIWANGTDNGTPLYNTFTQNSVYRNFELGIELRDGGNTELPAPIITTFDLNAGTVSGTACSDCQIEVFSDMEDEGQWYEDSTIAGADGQWNINLGRAFVGPNVTATATDVDGNTSEFSVEQNQPPDCAGAVPSIETIWPANHKFVAIEVQGVTDADGDPVSVTINSIFQDEPVEEKGDGNSEPDGQGLDTSTAEVRAERSGNENGRVYHIGFSANDGQGAICTGEVLVEVPHDKKDAPIDDGPLYDSTIFDLDGENDFSSNDEDDDNEDDEDDD